MWAGISFAIFALSGLLFAAFVQEPMAYLKKEDESLYRQLGGATAPLWSWSWGQLALFVALGSYKNYALSVQTIRGFNVCRALSGVQLLAAGAFVGALVI